MSYLIPAAFGQIGLLAGSVPISEVIERESLDGDGGSLTEDQLAKLILIRDVREYAREVMGLSVEDNYTTFYDSGGHPVAFNVSASRKDAFVPRVWKFPIVATVPYLGFFDRPAAKAKVRELKADGLDVFMYEIDAYSGLGFFPNPVLSPMLDRSKDSIASTVCHELLHATVWAPGNTSFNESLATFFGRTGAVHYFADRYPDEPGLVGEVIERAEDTDSYSDAMLELYNELDEFYSSDLSSEEKIAGREAVFEVGRERFAAEVQPLMNSPEAYDWVRDLPSNNAWMLGIRRYNLDLEVFERVFAATGEDWATSLEVFDAASEASDPYSHLRSWLETAATLPTAR